MTIYGEVYGGKDLRKRCVLSIKTEGVIDGHSLITTYLYAVPDKSRFSRLRNNRGIPGVLGRYIIIGHFLIPRITTWAILSYARALQVLCGPDSWSVLTSRDRAVQVIRCRRVTMLASKHVTDVMFRFYTG